MATTTAAKLFSPEVYADSIAAKITGAARVAGSRAVATDTTLQGEPGTTVIFPSTLYIGDADDLTDGVAMTPVELGQNSIKATIKEAGKSVEITDKAINSAVGKPQDAAIEQVAISVARKQDADLIAAAFATVVGGVKHSDGSPATDSAPKTITVTGFGYDQITDVIGVAGDSFEPSQWTLFVRTPQATQLRKDEDFVKYGNQDTVRTGAIGTVAGVEVVQTDRLPAAKAALVRDGALGLISKAGVLVEQDRDVLKRSNVVASSVHYAAARLSDDGVIAVTVS